MRGFGRRAAAAATALALYATEVCADVPAYTEFEGMFSPQRKDPSPQADIDLSLQISTTQPHSSH